MLFLDGTRQKAELCWSWQLDSNRMAWQRARGAMARLESQSIKAAAHLPPHVHPPACKRVRVQPAPQPRDLSRLLITPHL